MAFGDALAQGLIKGLGTGYSQHIANEQREKQDARKLAQSFDMFKKQTQYSYALENIGKQNDALGAWENAAKLKTGDLAYQVATKMASNFSKEDRPKFFRDAMKNLNGLTKAELLSRAGYNKPDYSQWADNPDYADAIPKARIAGMTDTQGMDEVFKYTPPKQEAGQEDPLAGKQWQVEQKQRREAYSQSLLANPFLIQQGVTGVDPVVLNQIDTSLQFGKQDPVYVDGTTGMEINRIDDEVIRGLSSGKYAVVDGQVMPATKAQRIMELETEYQATQETPMGAQETPMEQPRMEQPQAEVPMTSQERARIAKEEKVTQQRYRKDAKGIADNVAKQNITGVVDAIETAEKDLKSLDQDALGYVYSALNETQGNPRKAIDYIRKEKDPKAREAAMALQSLMGVLNVELKDRSGAAVTEAEAERFFAELGRASAVGSLEETLKGLTNLRQQKLSKVEGYLQGQEEGTVEQFFSTSPKYAKYFDEHETYGSDEGKARSALRNEIKSVAAELLEQASPQEVNQYLQEVYGEDAERLGVELPK